jgi:soluble lytic murein transglycosylase-like protein
MKSSVDAAPAISFFETFVYISLIALVAAFFTMIARHSSVSYGEAAPYGSSVTMAFGYAGPATEQQGARRLFRGLIRIPSFSFPSKADDELQMSPQALMDRWQPFITEASERFSIPEKWIRTIIRIESGGRTTLFGKPITSGAGAMGVMQLMAQTYDEMRARNGLGADPYNVRDNILAGTAYLHDLYTRYGYPHLFAAYNAGPGRLEQALKHRSALPAETRAYVRFAVIGTSDRPLADLKDLRLMVTDVRSVAKKSKHATRVAAESKHATRVAAIYQPAS